MTEFIADQLRRMRGEGPKKVSYEKLAAELGIKKPQVYNIVNHGKGAGPAVERALAERLFGGSIDKLRAAAEQWSREGRLIGQKADNDEVSHFRYAALDAVLRRAGVSGRWSPSAVAAAQSMQLDGREDPGEPWWTETLDRLDAAIKVSVPKLPDRQTNALAELDERPVRTARKKR